MQKITTFLWYDDQAEQAANQYVGLFDDSRVVDTRYYGQAGPGPAGSVMMVVFELGGQRLMALNGGPHHRFTEAVSLYVDCADQAEVDRLWSSLSEGGEEGPCGWLKDRYGLSWQIVPRRLPQLLADPDPAVAGRAMQAMMGMKKIDVAAVEAAAAGR